MYDEGQGVPQDYKQAMKWYTKAAEQGNAHAQYNIGLMYHNGKGVIQNNKKAYIWWAISAAGGDEDAIKNRDLKAKELSPKALEEAQEEAGKLYDEINSAKN
jgi:TPR repeat protein